MHRFFTLSQTERGAQSQASTVKPGCADTGISAPTADRETDCGSGSHCQNLRIRRMKAAIKAEPRRSLDSLLIQVNPTPESNPLHHAYLIAYFVISNPNLLQLLGSAAPCHVTVAAERKNWRRDRKHDCLCMADTQQCSTFNGPRWQSDKAAQIKEQWRGKMPPWTVDSPLKKQTG